MANIIDLTEKREENLPHEVFEAMCWKCGHRWIAVKPEKTLLKDLKCGNCRRAGWSFKTGENMEQGG